LKPAYLRPKAKDDRKNEVRYYRSQAGPAIAEELVRASRLALQQIEQAPGIGSPRLGHLAEIFDLRSWRIADFPLIWFYFERDDHLDVVRLLGKRQDMLTILGEAY